MLTLKSHSEPQRFKENLITHAKALPSPAVELKNRIEADLGVDLPVLKVLEGQA